MAIMGAKFRVVLRIDQVAQGVALPGLHEGVVGARARSPSRGACPRTSAPPCPRRSWSRSRRGEEGGDARARRAHALRQRALRVELHLDLPRQRPSSRRPCSRPRRSRSSCGPASSVSRNAIPKSLVPALLLIMVRPFVPRSRRAARRFSGIPHRPKPETMMEAPSGMSRTASAASFTTLFMIAMIAEGVDGLRARGR